MQVHDLHLCIFMLNAANIRLFSETAKGFADNLCDFLQCD